MTRKDGGREVAVESTIGPEEKQVKGLPMAGIAGANMNGGVERAEIRNAHSATSLVSIVFSFILIAITVTMISKFLLIPAQVPYSG